MIKAIFFDAVGTLFYLTRTVGHHYALVGSEVGLTLDARQLDRAFYSAWKKMPFRAAIDGPRANDDKDWWHQLVDLVLDQIAPSLSQFDRDNFSKSPMNILQKRASGSFTRTFPASWSNCNLVFSSPYSQVSMDVCDSFFSTSVSQGFLRTFSSPAKLEQTNLI